MNSRLGSYERHLPVVSCPVPEPLTGEAEPAPLTRATWVEITRRSCLESAEALLAGSATWFSHEIHTIGSPPDWFLDPASCHRFPDTQHHWSRCRPFAGSDIKRCWELSRWGWAPLLARAWRFTGDHRFRNGLNHWSQSWCSANPVNAGSNWLCGQEASIRLLHAVQAWQLADSPVLKPHSTLYRSAFVAAHLHRIAASEHYAQAQDNNHWTSEAAALFIGGSWLAASGSSHAVAGRRWAVKGRRALELSVARLVMPDGSFAQHSLTYHRLLLDTLAQVELWCRALNLPPFSEAFQKRCTAATQFLAALLDPLSGDGPNLGSNDGTFCYQLHSQPYRDFRPTLQLASYLFNGRLAVAPGPWDEPLHWMGLTDHELDDSRIAPSSVVLYPDGGYVLLRPSIGSWALLRLPVYRFRPAHADPLHLDLWHQGVNLLRDGGSYAYNASAADLSYFPGIASHNCVQFDGAEPMPRLGRFLWGDWLQLEQPPELVRANSFMSITASYRCPHGCHQRHVDVDGPGQCWTIRDTISGFRHSAVLRWRLAPGDWSQHGCGVSGALARLGVSSDQPFQRLQLVDGWESRWYGAKSILPVLEIEVLASTSPITITTVITLL